MNQRPETNEYNAYYLPYINRVPDGNITDLLDQQRDQTIQWLQTISESTGSFRYDTDKWSIKEVIGHIADTERIMAYRLLCIARGETASLPGFDEKSYVKNAGFDKQSLEDLLENFLIVRQSTLPLLKSLTDEDWIKVGLANHTPVTVRAIAFIIAGHELHHREIIMERYLKSQNYPHKF
jgi:uncharacterized damage-inducible protein DinB